MPMSYDCGNEMDLLGIPAGIEITREIWYGMSEVINLPTSHPPRLSP